VLLAVSKLIQHVLSSDVKQWNKQHFVNLPIL